LAGHSQLAGFHVRMKVFTSPPLDVRHCNQDRQ